MNLNFYSQKDYKDKSNWTLGENKPNSNPISNAHKPIKEMGRKKGVRKFFWLSVAGKDLI